MGTSRFRPFDRAVKRKEEVARNQHGNSKLHRRYWNEFNDEYEAPENEPDVLYIDPDLSSSFPRLKLLSKFGSTIGSNVGTAWQKFSS